MTTVLRQFARLFDISAPVPYEFRAKRREEERREEARDLVAAAWVFGSLPR